MRSHLAFLLFAFLLLGGTVYPAIGQTSSNDNVVINEVDINPPGDDSLTVSEWVELYNPTDSAVDVGGWEIASTTILKKTFTIPQGTIIEPGGFLTYSYSKIWFTDVSELVQLRDSEGNIIDETPVLTDVSNDFSSWQRLYDGFDTNLTTNWRFGTSSAGSTNGQLIVEDEEAPVSISIEVNKSEFLFGETAYISGIVSENVYIKKPTFQVAPIEILITGPGLYKPLTLFPKFLDFETTLKLDQVLGIQGGIYDVTVNYAGATAQTKFSVGNEKIIFAEAEDNDLSISFDAESYIPGQTVAVTGVTKDIIPYEGLKFKVLDATGTQIFAGTLFPNSSGEFTTELFMTTVSPNYGEHRVIVEYAGLEVESTFELLEDIKEDVVISLHTDKPAYGLGDTVIITGRLNKSWVFALDLQITQVGTGSILTESLKFTNQKHTVFLEGDSTFYHEFKILDNSQRLGKYQVTVSKNVGEASIFFKVVENPDEYVESEDAPLSISTDKTIYESGDKFTISGKVLQKETSSQFYNKPVYLVVRNDDTGYLFSSVHKASGNKPEIVRNTLTAVPDLAGRFQIHDTLYNTIFGEGSYTIQATYLGDIYATTNFSIVDPLKIDTFGQVKLNKDIFGLGEEVVAEGFIPNSAQGTGLKITLFQPDGKTRSFGVLLDDSRFSWSWRTPIAEIWQPTTTNERVRSLTSVYGVYQLVIGTNTGSVNVFFKVSPDPENDSLTIAPLDVSTDRPIYHAGETMKVLGIAQKRTQGLEGLVVADRAHISIKTTDFPVKEIVDAHVYLDTGGSFESSFNLPITIFKEGNYLVTATYGTYRAETLFTVDNEFQIGGDEALALIVDSDKDEYGLGETVHTSGRLNKLVYLDKVKITVVHEEQIHITCGTYVCGSPGKTITVKPSPSGSFTFDYTISTSDAAKGKYEIDFVTEFGTFPLTFEVTDKSAIIETPSEPEPLVSRATEVFTGISDSTIRIFPTSIQSAEGEMLPRIIQGSLLTKTRADQSNVNLKVTTESGLCIIGPETDCMISKSTRAPGQIYEIVSIDEMNYKVRYSGPDVRLEKFTILPESDDATLPESAWNVEIIKGDQGTKFYYKLTRVLAE